MMYEAYFRRTCNGLTALVLLSAAVGCQTPGYRTEVYPGQEGRAEVRRVPDNTPPVTVHRIPSADTDLNTIESLWPKLTPDDRQRVADMARRLAETQK
jgi:hypothetical protein